MCLRSVVTGQLAAVMGVPAMPVRGMRVCCVSVRTVAVYAMAVCPMSMGGMPMTMGSMVSTKSAEDGHQRKSGKAEAKES